MKTDQGTPHQIHQIEDQQPNDSPLTLEATPSGDRAYFCQLLHQKAEVLTLTPTILAVISPSTIRP